MEPEQRSKPKVNITHINYVSRSKDSKQILILLHVCWMCKKQLFGNILTTIYKASSQCFFFGLFKTPHKPVTYNMPNMQHTKKKKEENFSMWPTLKAEEVPKPLVKITCLFNSAMDLLTMIIWKLWVETLQACFLEVLLLYYYYTTIIHLAFKT